MEGVMHDAVDASLVMVSFKDQDGNVTQVPVSSLLNEIFTVLFKIEERLAVMEQVKDNKPSPIITLDKL